MHTNTVKVNQRVVLTVHHISASRGSQYALHCALIYHTLYGVAI